MFVCFHLCSPNIRNFNHLLITFVDHSFPSLLPFVSHFYPLIHFLFAYWLYWLVIINHKRGIDFFFHHICFKYLLLFCFLFCLFTVCSLQSMQNLFLHTVVEVWGLFQHEKPRVPTPLYLFIFFPLWPNNRQKPLKEGKTDFASSVRELQFVWCRSHVTRRGLSSCQVTWLVTCY